MLCEAWGRACGQPSSPPQPRLSTASFTTSTKDHSTGLGRAHEPYAELSRRAANFKHDQRFLGEAALLLEALLEGREQRGDGPVGLTQVLDLAARGEDGGVVAATEVAGHLGVTHPRRLALQ